MGRWTQERTQQRVGRLLLNNTTSWEQAAVNRKSQGWQKVLLKRLACGTTERSQSLRVLVAPAEKHAQFLTPTSSSYNYLQLHFQRSQPSLLASLETYMNLVNTQKSRHIHTHR